MRFLLLFLLTLQSVAYAQPLKPPAEVVAKGDLLYQPRDSVRMAIKDLETNVEKDSWADVRYFSLYNVPAADRQKYIRILSFVCNSLSRHAVITRVEPVPGSENTLIRVYMRDYKWKAQSWDRLSARDYVFRVQALVQDTPLEAPSSPKKTRTVKKRTEVLVGRDRRGNPIFRTVEEDVVEEVDDNTKVAPEKPSTKKSGIVQAPAGLDYQQLAKLLAYTGAELTPIVRGDWFIANAILGDTYYDFLQFGKTEDDFRKAIGLDVAAIKLIREEFLRDQRAAVVRSGVTRNNRRLNWTSSPLGDYWFSSDFLTNIKDQNVVRILLTDAADASEQIATAPNNLQWYFVVDKARKRLDEADIKVALDNNFPDHRVITGRSCMVCHSSGILSFKSDTKRLVRDKVTLESFSSDVRKTLLAIYGEDLDDVFEAGQVRYSKAIKKTNGLTPEENANQLKELWLHYAEHDLTLADVSLELGYSEKELTEVFKKSTDPILLGLINVNPVPVRREQWEEVFQLAMLLAEEAYYRK